MKVSLVIPTWRRAESLKRCLEAIEKQVRAPDEVLIIVREDDDATREMLAALDTSLPIQLVPPPGPGVVRALNAGLDAAVGDVIVITDDDSEPLADWLQRIEGHFAADEGLGGLGGRDLVTGLEEIADDPAGIAVGKVHWFGRVVGNHHLATGDPRQVDIIKGVNMSLRSSALGGRRLSSELRGPSVQQNWEIELCLALRSEGWRLLYDPAVEVLHHESPRPGGEREKQMSAEERYDAVFNQTLAVVSHLRGLRRLSATSYALLVGTRDNPGPFLAVETALRGTPPHVSFERMKVATGARRAAIRRWRRLRSAGD